MQTILNFNISLQFLPDFLFPDRSQPFHERYFPSINFKDFHSRHDFIHQFDPFVLCFHLLRLKIFAKFAEHQVERNQHTEYCLEMKKFEIKKQNLTTVKRPPKGYTKSCRYKQVVIIHR